MLDLVTNSFLSKLASHEYHASKSIPPEAKRKYGLKKERREYEAEKPVPPEVAEDLGLEEEHHKEAEAAFMGALLTKLARPIPPISSYAYRDYRNVGGQGRDRRDSRQPDRREDRRDWVPDRRNSPPQRGLTAADVADIFNKMDRKNKSDEGKKVRNFYPSYDAMQIAPPIPQNIVVDLPSSKSPSLLGRLSGFGGVGALANLLLGDKEKSPQERAIKGALFGAGLGGLYHLLKR